jgi:hypothetical protein
MLNAPDPCTAKTNLFAYRKERPHTYQMRAAFFGYANKALAG